MRKVSLCYTPDAFTVSWRQRDVLRFRRGEVATNQEMHFEGNGNGELAPLSECVVPWRFSEPHRYIEHWLRDFVVVATLDTVLQEEQERRRREQLLLRGGHAVGLKTKKIRVAKLDVEGHEVAVLRGGRGTIFAKPVSVDFDSTREPPCVLYVENHAAHIETHVAAQSAKPRDADALFYDTKENNHAEAVAEALLKEQVELFGSSREEAGPSLFLYATEEAANLSRSAEERAVFERVRRSRAMRRALERAGALGLRLAEELAVGKGKVPVVRTKGEGGGEQAGEEKEKDHVGAVSAVEAAHKYNEELGELLLGELGYRCWVFAADAGAREEVGEDLDPGGRRQTCLLRGGDL